MAAEAVPLTRRPGVATMTLNIPEKRNAMVPALTAGFGARLAEVRQDPDLKVLILTGAGDAFCAGGDLAMLSRMAGSDPESNRREMGAFYRNYLALLDLDMPVIAAVNGSAIGAGLSLAMACDIRLCAAGAKLSAGFLNLGLHPGMGTTHLLPALIGYPRAAELVFTGRAVAAEEAAAMGLVNRVVEAEQLLAEANAMADAIAAKSAAGLRMAKRAMMRGLLHGLEAALDYEATAQGHSYASAELQQALDRLIR